jgi:fosfomycin resistance protein FosX
MESGFSSLAMAKSRYGLRRWRGGPLPTRTYNHVAFKIADSEYEDYLLRVRALGLEVREGRSRVPGEGQSIYFYDHDNHMFELHTGTLDERLKRYTKGH